MKIRVDFCAQEIANHVNCERFDVRARIRLVVSKIHSIFGKNHVRMCSAPRRIVLALKPGNLYEADRTDLT